MNRSTRLTIAAIAATLAASPTLDAQDSSGQETRTVEAGGLKFDVPTAWNVSQPTSQMRLLEVAIPPAEGDAKPGELAVFAFPGGAGTVQMNVDRWRQQFVDDRGANPEIETETIKAGEVEVTLVEAAGRYVTQIPRPVDEPNFRLLGGIYTTPQTGYFFKLVGPDKTIQAARPAFRAMLESMAPAR